MTTKLRIVLIILLSLQTKMIHLKPSSSFLRSPFYVDFTRSDIGLYNKLQEEESLEKKANSIELEAMTFSNLYNAWYTKKSVSFSRYSLWILQLSQDEREAKNVFQISKQTSSFKILVFINTEKYHL